MDAALNLAERHEFQFVARMFRGVLRIPRLRLVACSLPTSLTYRIGNLLEEQEFTQELPLGISSFVDFCISPFFFKSFL